MNKNPMYLRDISHINLGYPFRGRIKEVLGSAVFAVQMKDVSKENGVSWASCVPTELQGRAKHDWLEEGDILFAARGNHNYAVTIDQAIASRMAVASPHFYVIRCNQAKVLPRYLAWILNHGPCQRYFERESEGSVTKSIRRDVLANTQIALLSLAEQQKVVQLIDALQRQQQVLQAQLQNNQRLMAGIAQQIYNDQPGDSRG